MRNSHAVTGTLSTTCQRPDLPFSEDLDGWKKFISEQSSMTSRGASIARLVDNLRKINDDSSGDLTLSIVPLTLVNIESAEEFLKHNPPIPLIVVFDSSLNQ